MKAGHTAIFVFGFVVPTLFLWERQAPPPRAYKEGEA